MASNTPVTVAVTRPNLDEHKLAELAFELARNLRDPDDIFKMYKITPEQYAQHIDTNPWFKRVLEAAMIEWASTGSTKTRIQHQAALALEQGIIPLTKRMLDDDEDLGKSTEVAKLLAKIAGLDSPNLGGGAPGEKFTITINLGADQQLKIEKTLEPGPAIIEATATTESSPSPIPHNPEGEGSALALRPIPEGQANLHTVQIIPEGTGHEPSV